MNDLMLSVSFVKYFHIEIISRLSLMSLSTFKEDCDFY